MSRALVLTSVLLAAPVLAGCLGGVDEPIDRSDVSVDTPPIVSGDRSGTMDRPLLWTGRELTAKDDDAQGSLLAPAERTPAPCEQLNCDRIPFALSFPPDQWDVWEGGVEVSVQTNQSDWAALRLTILDGSGAELVRGTQTTYAAHAWLDRPASGNYVAEIVAEYGSGAYRGVVQIEASAVDHGEARELLPNLVMMEPRDIRLPGDSEWVPPIGPIVFDSGVEGCDLWEHVEQGAKRCLRFTTTLGNLGPGDLEVRLDFENGALALAGQGRFVQRIHASDGTFRDEPVDGATFHPTHAHFHYRDLAVFELYEYDPESRTRGDAVGQTGKSGFCFFDMGLVLMDHAGTNPPRFASEARCSTEPEHDWVTGVSAGWFDRYWSSLSDQYVEVTGLPDGVYELVTTANGGGTLVESSLDDNAAGAVIEITEDEVVVLGTWADYLGGPSAMELDG